MLVVLRSLRRSSPRAARPLLFAGFALFALAADGCTFLVDFVQASAECEGGACLDGGDASLDVSAESAADAPLDTGPKRCDLYKPDGSRSPCSINLGLGVGFYCACHALNNYGGSPDDLVQCRTDGSVLTATSCANGCANFPQGYRDECDNCVGKSGKYCAPQLGYDGGPRLIIICDKGKAFSVDECSNGGSLIGNCVGPPGTAACN